MNYDIVLFVLGFAVVAVLAIYGLYRLARQDTKPTQVNMPPMKAPQSWASGQLKQEFFAIPLPHRPSVDINSVLSALDTKHGIEEVNQHFRTVTGHHQGATKNWSWDHNCRTTLCPLQDYTNLHQHMGVLMEAYKKHEHALLVAEQQHGFEQMHEMLASLKDEALSLVDSTTSIEKDTKS